MKRFWAHLTAWYSGTGTAYQTWMSALIPVFFIGFSVQACVTPGTVGSRSGPFHGNDASFVNYIAISGVHWIACISLIGHSICQHYRNASKSRERSIRKHALLSILGFSLTLVCCVSVFDWDIEMLSHQLVYARARTTPAIGALMRKTLMTRTPFTFFPFSVIPMGSVLLAFWTVICISFELSVSITSLRAQQATDLERWKERIEVILRDIKWCFARILLVLVISSTATSVYFSLGVDADVTSKAESFKGIADAMSFLWGAVFSLMAGFMFMVPAGCYQRKLAQLSRASAVHDKDTTNALARENESYSLLSMNLRYVLGCLLPMAGSLIGSFLS